MTLVAAFWCWFAGTHLFSEGSSAVPYVARIVGPFVLLVVVAWKWPKVGGLMAIAGGVFAAWYFPHPAPRLMMALPLVLAGVTLIVMGRRAHR